MQWSPLPWHRSQRLESESVAPRAAHSRRVASQWSDRLKGTRAEDYRVLAVSRGTLSEPIRYARAKDWAVQVVIVDPASGLEESRALTSRTPWVFAIDGEGRVLDEGHGSRLEEVAAACGRIPQRSGAWAIQAGAVGRAEVPITRFRLWRC